MPIADYLVLAPLQQEWTKILPILTANVSATTEIQDGALTFTNWAQPVSTHQYEGEYLVAATPISLWTPGSSLTASVATKAIGRWHPSRVVLVGIAGSIEPNMVRLGDVVVAAEVRGYEVTDAIDPKDGGERLRATFNQPGAIDLNRATTFSSDTEKYEAWRTACFADAAAHGLDTVTRKPELHLGVVASGNRVVKSVAFGERLRKEIDKYIVAVEMEARAVHQAVYVDAGRTDGLTVRGISDYADAEKEKLEKGSKDGWRTWAAANAARFVKALWERGTVPPLSRPLALDLSRGTFKLFAEAGLRDVSFKHVGSHDIVFPSLMRRAGPIPAMTLDVSATTKDGAPATDFRLAVVMELPERRVVHAGNDRRGGMSVRVPASDWGLNAAAFLSFQRPVREIVVTCRDEFAREDSRSIALAAPVRRPYD